MSIKIEAEKAEELSDFLDTLKYMLESAYLKGKAQGIAESNEALRKMDEDRNAR